MNQPQNKERKPRIDARKNRERILEVATKVFDQSGLNTSMEAIAKQAGVGIGTLYRNFPNRQALVAAVLEQQGLHAPQLNNQQSKTSLEALEQWIHALAMWFTTYEGLTEPLRQAADEYSSPLGMHCHDVITTLDGLINTARIDGHIAENITGHDLYLAVLGIAWAAQHTDSPDRLLAILAEGWKRK